MITAVAFELVEKAFEHGGAGRAGISFFAGATAFILIDGWLERRTEQRRARGDAVGLALLAGVTLDGVPENLAMGVALLEGSALTLLVAIFASNLPEAIVGAEKMRDDRSDREVILIWSGTAVLLAVAVVVGYAALKGVSEDALSWPLGFAAGAVLASLADTLMPEAFSEGGPPVASATALGFLASFLISAAWDGLLVAGAGEHRDPGIARVARIAARAQAEAEYRSPRVGHQLLVSAAIAETVLGRAHLTPNASAAWRRGSRRPVDARPVEAARYRSRADRRQPA